MTSTRSAFPLALTLAAALATGACGKADAPSGPLASSTASAPDTTPSPPAKTEPPVSLPPLPENITAAPKSPDATAKDAATATTTAKDSPATQPKAELTPEDEKNRMPMAAHGNNHSSPSLEDSKQGTKQ